MDNRCHSVHSKNFHVIKNNEGGQRGIFVQRYANCKWNHSFAGVCVPSLARSGFREFGCSCVRVLVRSCARPFICLSSLFPPFLSVFPFHLEHTYVSLFCIRLFLQTEWETHCHFCHSSSVEESPLNRCRICPRVYHTNCLAKRGHLSGDGAAETLTLANSEIGWSCCNCVSWGSYREISSIRPP